MSDLDVASEQPSTPAASRRLIDEAGIRAAVEARRQAWNAQDLDAYGRLLTEDAELTSATGKTARGRAEILRLYAAQRQAAYRDASLRATVVRRIDFVDTDTADAEATFEMTNVFGERGDAIASIEGVNRYRLVRVGGRWLMSSIRGTANPSIDTPDARQRNQE